MERKTVSDMGSTSVGLTCPLPHVLIPGVLELVALSGELMHRALGALCSSLGVQGEQGEDHFWESHHFSHLQTH